MSLAPGTRVGVYEVISLLGAGGMGEVYRARDARLRRDVALKILPDHFASDPDRLARFEREAQVLATLTHPNIGHIYGLENTGGAPVLVLELIEAPTLADRIARGPIPVADAVEIATQIASALDAAHERGIIHRDLKPRNIKVTDDGKVKVLDFGLAKLTRPAEARHYVRGLEGSLSQPDMTEMPSAALTGTNVILGTAVYMSPEQALGKAVDRRADVWALGCVLFEMVTGKRAFDGTGTPEVIAGVVHAEPEWTALPEGTPAKLVALLKRCLEKDPKQRLRDIGDARFELDQVLGAPMTGDLAYGSVARVPLWRRTVSVAAAVVVTAGVAGSIAWAIWPGSARPLARFNITLPADDQFTYTGTLVAVSATHIVFCRQPAIVFTSTRSARSNGDWR